MKLSTRILLVAVAVSAPTPVFALGTETFGNAPAAKQPEWAVGVIDVVNLKSRVYSYWVNGNENFFYRGDAAALNEALKAFAAIKDDERRVILLPGTGQTQPFNRKPITFDWKLHVPSGMYRAATKQTHAVLTVYVPAAKPAGGVDKKAIEKWIEELDSVTFQTREAAQEELRKLGREVKPNLRAALGSRPSAEQRARIEKLLNGIGSIDAGDLDIPKGVTVVVVEDLLAEYKKGLASTDPTLSGLAVQGLTGLAPYSDEVIPLVAGMLVADKNEYVRRSAAGCLGYLGAAAKSALPALKAGLEDADANVRAAFKAAVEQIESAKEPSGKVDAAKVTKAILKELEAVKKSAAGK